MAGENNVITERRNSVSAEQIRAYVERYERLGAEKKDISEDQKALMAEAKANGFDTKILKHCVKVRAMKPADYQEAQALADMYLSALGMMTDPPLFRAANRIAVDTAAKESVVEALKNFVPENGSIIIEAGGAPIRLTRDKDGNVSSQEVIEKPLTPRADAPERHRAAAPVATAEEAEEMGEKAAKDNVPIIKNPFPFGDERRPLWDRGWRNGAGNSGFGPE